MSVFEMTRILVVDDEAIIRHSLDRLLKQAKYTVMTAASFEEARQILLNESIQLVVLDLVLPDRSGMDLLALIRTQHANTEVIMLTGHGSIDSAVEATKQGAFAYLPKPFEKEVMLISIRNALETLKLKTENSRLKDTLRDQYRFHNIVGASTAMQNIFRTIEKIAKTDSTVLITGESGTGKELIAKAIHFSSERSKYHMIPINCSAIPEDLLESELFGHVKGAFTGAVANRMGRFEAANGGTLFLDEIGDTPLNIQIKLLRVLQEKSFEPVGSNKKISVDVRIITATNQDIRALIEKKAFREDLFYRLNVIPIKLPPLRERKEDIPLLIRFFINRICKRQRRQPIELDDYTLHLLIEYPWPGNVRELENIIEQLIVFSDGRKIAASDLPERFLKSSGTASSPDKTSSVYMPPTGINFNQIIDDMEERLIIQALEMTSWNKNRAAQLLKLNRTTLVEKMKKKNIRRPQPASIEKP